MPPILRSLVPALALLIAAQQLLVTFLHFQFAGREGGTTAVLAVALRFFFAAVLWNYAQHRLPTDRTTAFSALALATVLAGLLLGGRRALDLGDQIAFKQVRTRPRIAGHFPFDPNRIIDEYAGDWHYTARIGPEGHRVCGTQPPDAPTVALIGDSFIFGKGVEDADTLCAALRPHLGDRARLLNFGQPGAHAGSYADNLRFAAEAYHSDASVVGIHVPDDCAAFDINELTEVISSPLFQAVGTITSPVTLLRALGPLQFNSRAEGVCAVIFTRHLTRLRETLRTYRKPTLVFLYGDRGAPYDRYQRLVEQSIKDLPHVLITPPHDIGQDGYLKGDWHPNAEGNRRYAAHLAPWIRRLLSEASP